MPDSDKDTRIECRANRKALWKPTLHQSNFQLLAVFVTDTEQDFGFPSIHTT
ncbi:hypothetical protein PN499_17585 [Kamptonema animale CS-326]|uniref:hypothetical protein n=1 Tax=Kamptonema animale TaxID=92934 RepID=UPI00232B6A1B|nr:hypothetical protein [Kamptonema animale]MDB9513006.1 hypothetical protein [Kamptonema animale CS-326]